MKLTINTTKWQALQSSLVILLFILTLQTTYSQNYAGGDGSENNPYQISTWHHLDNVRLNLTEHFILTTDLDSETSGYNEFASATSNTTNGWQPIGELEAMFTGSFNGNNKHIKDLYIERSNQNQIGLFGYTNSAEIHHLNLLDVIVTGGENTGGLIGLSKNTKVEQVQVTGTITGTLQTGGVIGFQKGDDSSIKTSKFNGAVEGENAVGGLVGTNYGVIETSMANANISGDFLVGGLVGLNQQAYTITLNSSPGSGGTATVTVAYGDSMPIAEAPTINASLGTFLGYYSQTNGQGEQYYDYDMSSAKTWDLEEDTTLYAYWVDFCEGNPCENGGTCTNDQQNLTFKCECPELYTGTRCEHLDACVVYANANDGDSPCVTGSCVSDDGGIRCNQCDEGNKCACCDGFDFDNLSCSAQGKEPTGAYCIDPGEISDMALFEKDNPRDKNYTRFASLQQKKSKNDFAATDIKLN